MSPWQQPLNSLVIFLLVPYITQCAVIKSVELTPSNTNENGARILSSNIDAQIQNDLFTISATTQQGYSWIIDLDDTWGFNPDQLSTISFTISSPATSNTATCDGFITVLANDSNNYQYITYWMAFDLAIASEGVNWIYPPCDNSVPATQTFPTDDVISCVEQNTCGGRTGRFDKVTGSQGFDKSNSAILPSNYWHRNSWPLIFSLTNDPINNEASTTINTASWNEWSQGCGYAQSFATNVGLQIYIALDADGEYVEFDTFSIQYLHDTLAPTQQPTAEPSAVPSQTPSRNPTKQPSEPTKAPSDNPSIAPSEITQQPTTPSVAPSEITQQPTTRTQMPSFTPSKQTQQPTTRMPSMDPTEITREPSAITQMPSMDPTKTSYAPTAITQMPSMDPTESSYAPTLITLLPSIAPTARSYAPTTMTQMPSNDPISSPSDIPTAVTTPSPTQVATVIYTLFTDDFMFDDEDESSGWMHDSDDSTISRITTASNETYHGPFYGNNGYFELTRWFQCSEYAIISIEYKLLCCKNNNHADVALYINDELQHHQYCDDVDTLSSYPEHSACGRIYWKRTLQNIGNMIKTKHESFIVTFKAHSLHANDPVAIANIKVHCGASLSDSPTNEPTESPENPSISPISTPSLDPTLGITYDATLTSAYEYEYDTTSTLDSKKKKKKATNKQQSAFVIGVLLVITAIVIVLLCNVICCVRVKRKMNADFEFIEKQKQKMSRQAIKRRMVVEEVKRRRNKETIGEEDDEEFEGAYTHTSIGEEEDVAVAPGEFVIEEDDKHATRR